MNTIYELKTRAFGEDCRRIGYVEYLACYPEWPFFSMCRMVTDWGEKVDNEMYWFLCFMVRR